MVTKKNIDPADLFGRLYLMRQEGSAGIQWKGEVDKEMVAKELLQLDKAFLETVDLYLFAKVCFQVSIPYSRFLLREKSLANC